MEERIIRSTKRFLYTGQPTSEWPNWMIFKNFAHDQDRTFITFADWDGRHYVYRGDTVEQTQSGTVTIIRKKDIDPGDLVV